MNPWYIKKVTMGIIIKSYADLIFHREIGELIQKHSENKEDIRNIAKHEIRGNKIHTLLDLGCGYGWFEESLEKKFDMIFGIDCLKEHKKEFLRTAKKIAEKTIFSKMKLPLPINLPDESFDLIVSAYSLYFFPEIIPEVKRLLCSEGIFLVITHSESMLAEGEDFFDFSNLREIIRQFSAENGEAVLKQYFNRITSIDYRNTLFFNKNDSSDLAAYIDFKKEFILRDMDPDIVKIRILDELKKRVVLDLTRMTEFL